MASIRLVCMVLACVAFGASDALAGPKDCRGGSRRHGNCGQPVFNQPPVISGSPSGQASIGEPYAFAPAAYDPEGARLRFEIANKPPWASFSSYSGRLSGTPTAAAAGLYVDIVIRVSDGRTMAALAPFDIEVGGGLVNSPPSISGTPPTAAREGQAYEFRPAGRDADGDPLTFAIANRPSWAAFDDRTGRLSGTPGGGSVGVYPDVTIRVSDGQAVAALPAFSIAVEQASLGSVTLRWTAPTTRVDGSPLTGLAGYRVRYGTAPGSFPNVLQIANGGITTCVVENLPPGTYYFVVSAYDEAGLESAPSSVVSRTFG